MGLKLDDADYHILFELDRDCRIPETRLARVVNRSKEAVRYRLQKLEKEYIIRRYQVWLDLTKLGYTTAKIYLILANVPEEKEKLLTYVKQDKRLFWIGVGEGAWNIGLTYFVRTNREFFDLKNDLFSRFRGLIIETRIASVVDVYFHPKSFLWNEETEWGTLFERVEHHEIDDAAQTILKELLANARVNIATIAHKHNYTVDVVRSRMKWLEERGIIKRYTIALNYQKLGYEFYKTFLYFHNLDTKTLRHLLEYARTHPNIIHLVEQISDWDIELEIMCESFEHYNSIISNLTREFADAIRKVDTAIMSEDHLFPAKKVVFE